MRRNCRDIEQQVNDEIRLNTQIETNVTSLEEALASGAWHFSGQVPGAQRPRCMISIHGAARASIEKSSAAGRTCARRDIGVLKIVSEESVAPAFAGLKR